MSDPTLIAALGADGAWPFAAMKIELPDVTLRLLDGASRVTIAGDTYAGRDDTFGALIAIEPISESMDNEAPEFRFVFQPDDAASFVTLCNPAMQGSRITASVGCLNPATGAIIGTPEVIALLKIDVPRARLGMGSRQVEFTAVSEFERLFAVDEGERATDGAHQNVWPGELGLSGMTGTTQKLYWGGHAPAGAATGGIVRYGNANNPRYDFEIPA